MGDIEQPLKLRSLGRSEQLSAVSHALGFFNNVGLSAHYSLSENAPQFDLKPTIYAALARVIQEHAILSAIPVDEDSPDSYWVQLPTIDLARPVTFLTRARPLEETGEDSELDEILQEQHNIDFKSDYGTLPFWRLLILRDAENKLNFTASFIFYHAIGDGAAGLVFHKFFSEALNAASSSSEPLSNTTTLVHSSPSAQLLPTLEQLHPLPLNPNPADHRTPGLQEWTGDSIRLPCQTHYRTLYLSPTSSTAFTQKCKSNKLSVTAGLQATLAHALFDTLPPITEALTGIIPINLRPWLNLPSADATNAIGSFIDAIKVQIPRSHFAPEGNDTVVSGLSAARHTADAITRYLTGNPSPSGEPYTSVAFFGGIPDVAVAFKSMVGAPRDAAFEISNVGRFESGEAGRWQVGRMAFSRSAVAFGAPLNTSVVSGADGGLTIGFCWQEGVLEDAFVEGVVKGFGGYFESEGF
ncbi:hypothetical protein COCC4DRAFT_209277 [Bipolaris maydis ATCC 48331]|uniref:Alcohol acetyltransferase n=2 Tax=Cochliobolus heterostrophus TaxID=5016 RepID=M2UDN1_COCH5|nr:uncharacterized protein COCC4DRAFT_209277 [Bipolaris maydis ATCC 48331]EMD96664.1 hypothetical protein COCHEDRAFT_1162588 [Bipolaris maydis C5]KAJ5031454.1 alcohol acetyltransferase [Bipolaris maydis]ENH98770.1 hypothetical protein COCC4DRAFT_209277 [Bipolaris maydis ATCC 48331]KAJ6211311.1 alcohol acetyltransferase [Bipolaris maydis]KAJ6273691.1 alcohol acetyltransferase [Bipolaris maydis]